MGADSADVFPGKERSAHSTAGETGYFRAADGMNGTSSPLS